MIEATISQIRESLANILNRASFSKERITIVRHGKAICALVPMEDVVLLERLDARRIERAKRGLAEIEEEGGISWDLLKTKLPALQKDRE